MIFRALPVSLVLVVAFATSGCGGGPPAPAAPSAWENYIQRLRAGGLDVMLVVDTTGTMGETVLSLKTYARRLTRAIAKAVPEARVGIVCYRDKRKYVLDLDEEYQYTLKYIPLQVFDRPGEDRLQRFLGSTEGYSGGDFPDAVLDGVQAAIDKAGWSKNARRVIVVIGDAPPRPEDNGIEKTYAVCRKWKEGGGVLSCIDTAGEDRIMDEFRRMADEGGGEALSMPSAAANLEGAPNVNSPNMPVICQRIHASIFGARWGADLETSWNRAQNAPAPPASRTPAPQPSTPWW